MSLKPPLISKKWCSSTTICSAKTIAMHRVCVRIFVHLHACACSIEYRSNNLNSNNMSINDNDFCHYDHNFKHDFDYYDT